MNKLNKLNNKATNHKKRETHTAVIIPENALKYKILWLGVMIFLAALLLKLFLNNESENNKDQAKLSIVNWINRVYQENTEKDMLNKPFIYNLKKYKNEYEYSLFNKVNLDNYFVGKDHYMFEENITKAYFGDDYMGNTAIKEQVNKAQFVQNKLKSYGVELLILFAPGKGTIYPEYLPDQVLKTEKKVSNRETYIEECKKLNVNYIDFIQYFLSLKPLTKYPLFSQYGSHWSCYSEFVVIDTTIRRLEKLINTNLPNLIYGNIQLMDTAMKRDADILSKIPMNHYPKGKPLAYPAKVEFEFGNGARPQKILAIGDSYFRGFFYLNAMTEAFDNSKQWYYYNSIVPEDPGNPEVWELNLMDELLAYKAIVILCNEVNLKNLGNGFIDDAYLLLSNPKGYLSKRNERFEINSIKKKIRKNEDLLYKLTKVSQDRGITLDSLITETAIKLRGKKVNEN